MSYHNKIVTLTEQVKGFPLFLVYHKISKLYTVFKKNCEISLKWFKLIVRIYIEYCKRFTCSRFIFVKTQFHLYAQLCAVCHYYFGIKSCIIITTEPDTPLNYAYHVGSFNFRSGFTYSRLSLFAVNCNAL